jgi:hypothetical protein
MYRSLEKDAPRRGRSCGCLEFKGLRHDSTPRCRLFLTNFLSDSVFHTALSKGSSLGPNDGNPRLFKDVNKKVRVLPHWNNVPVTSQFVKF